GSDQVRKRTPLNLSGDDLIPLVDRVCAEVSDRSLHHGLVFLRSPLIAPVGRELGEVGACVHQRKVTASLCCAWTWAAHTTSISEEKARRLEMVVLSSQCFVLFRSGNFNYFVAEVSSLLEWLRTSFGHCQRTRQVHWTAYAPARCRTARVRA